MRLTALKYIETILETGSITKAAKKLFVSQPSLSQYIRRVEEDNDIELFDRTSQPWVLTEDGQFYMETERKIESIYRQREQFFSDKHMLTSGEVFIGSTQYRSNTVLSKVLPIYRKRYPDIKIHLLEGISSELVDLAEKGLVDCTLALEATVTNNLVCEPLVTERVLLCAPADHKPVKTGPVPPGGRFPSVKFSEFADDDFIVLKAGQVFHKFFTTLCAKYRIEPNVILEAQSITSIPALVEAGLGCALVPSPLADMTNHSVQYYDLGRDHPTTKLTIAWSRSRYLSRPAAAFINVAKEVMAKEMHKKSVVKRDGSAKSHAKSDQ